MFLLSFIWYTNIDVEHRHVVYLMCIVNIAFLVTILDLIKLIDEVAPLGRIIAQILLDIRSFVVVCVFFFLTTTNLFFLIG